MKKKLSQRLKNVIKALPINASSRILEIGCGPGAMAREMSTMLKSGSVLAIDRSASAIKQAKAGSSQEIKSGKLKFRQSSAEDFKLLPVETKFDFAVAIRVGAFDGRFPATGELAYRQIRKTLKGNGKLFIDHGESIRIFKPQKIKPTKGSK